LNAASFEVPEGTLIRDIIYVFQAIDGKYVKYDSRRDMYIVDPSVCTITALIILNLINHGFLGWS
jgi:hypothetical protein